MTIINSFQAIMVLEVRVTVFFTSKIHAIKKIKTILFPTSTEVCSQQPESIHASTGAEIELTSSYSTHSEVTNSPTDCFISFLTRACIF
jgi:hypothetical protein